MASKPTKGQHGSLPVTGFFIIKYFEENNYYEKTTVAAFFYKFMKQ
jgi:hypothetical protein